MTIVYSQLVVLEKWDNLKTSEQCDDKSKVIVDCSAALAYIIYIFSFQKNDHNLNDTLLPYICVISH